jgi:hypothetical protein
LQESGAIGDVTRVSSVGAFTDETPRAVPGVVLDDERPRRLWIARKCQQLPLPSRGSGYAVELEDDVCGTGERA